MKITANEALERVLRELTTELRSTHNIGSIERRVGRSRGYFSKVTARRWRISLDVLLHTLEVLDIDPTTFFANALAQPRPDERSRYHAFSRFQRNRPGTGMGLPGRRRPRGGRR